MLNKRGQGLSVNAIILIVLGVFVLAVLIGGFMLGWGTLKERIAPSNNVNTIVTACSTACLTQSVYDFCITPRDLKAEEVELKGVTCNYLAKKQIKYGIEVCGGISCDNVVLSEANNEQDAKNSCSGEKENDIVHYLDGNELKSYTCTESDILGSKSCTDDSVGGEEVCESNSKCSDIIDQTGLSDVTGSQVCCNVACSL